MNSKKIEKIVLAGIVCGMIVASGTIFNGVDAKAAKYGTDQGRDLVFVTENGKSYWYEGGVRQGTYSDPKGVMGDGTIRGREIYDPATNAWYWLDSVYNGAKATGKEVWMPYIYQNEKNWDEAEIRKNANASDEGMQEQAYQAIKSGCGKWVRYDGNGMMMKGWVKIEGDLAKIYPNQAGNMYYYDNKTGLMAKGETVIEGKTYFFDPVTGVLQQ